MKDYREDQAIFQHFNLSKRKRARNRFLILSIINFATFVFSIFAMLFYQWVEVEIALLGQFQKVSTIFISMWVNMLYAKRLDNSVYQSFWQISKQVCSQSDATCQSIFIQFWFIGYLSFMLFLFAYILQLLDFYRIFKYYVHSKKAKHILKYQASLQAKDSFRHVVIILCYTIGLSLDFFGLTLMNINDYHYGVSFWLFFISLLIFVVCIIYKNFSISRIAQQELILNLIEGQKNIRKQQLQNERISSSSNQFSI